MATGNTPRALVQLSASEVSGGYRGAKTRAKVRSLTRNAEARKMFRRYAMVAYFLALVVMAAGSAMAGGHGQIGNFEGASNHETTGRVEIVTKDGKTTVTLLSDFRFDGAPDPKVAFGKNGFIKSTILGPLQSNSGKQTYEVPAGLDVSDMNEVWIWCERFNVPLGVARY